MKIKNEKFLETNDSENNFRLSKDVFYELKNEVDEKFSLEYSYFSLSFSIKENVDEHTFPNGRIACYVTRGNSNNSYYVDTVVLSNDVDRMYQGFAILKTDSGIQTANKIAGFITNLFQKETPLLAKKNLDKIENVAHNDTDELKKKAKRTVNKKIGM